MSNKYYLREDRKAVTKEQYDRVKSERPNPGLYEDLLKYYDDFREWDQKLFDLPALDVDQDYLKRLSPGWFEGKERYEQECWDKWEEISKDEFDNTPYNKRLTIVAPQEAEKDLPFTGVVQDVDRTALEFDKIRSEIALVGKKCIQCGKEFTDRSGGSYCSIQCWDAHCLHGVPHLEQPATPQPVTGEEISFAELKWNIGSLFNQNIRISDNGKAIEGNPAVHAIAEYVHNLLAASRPSDAVEESIEKINKKGL